MYIAYVFYLVNLQLFHFIFNEIINHYYSKPESYNEDLYKGKDHLTSYFFERYINI